MNEFHYFTIPAEYTKESVNVYDKLNKTTCQKWPIREVYGTLNNIALPSARHHKVLPDCQIDFAEYVQYLKEHNIRFNYTFNVNCLGGNDLRHSKRVELAYTIQHLWDLGVRCFTVTMPSMVELINTIQPEAEVYLSIIFGLDSCEKLDWILEHRHIAGTYIHEKLIRNIASLEKLLTHCRERQVEPGILVNSLCDIHCPLREYHYNLSSHAEDTDEFPFVWYYGTECNLRRLNDPRKALRIPWVRPNDMEMYTSLGMTRFKFAGRDLIKFGADFGKTVEIYNSQNYQGNLMPLLMGFADCERADLYHFDNNAALDEYLKRVFNGTLQCHACNDCHYCDAICKTIFPDKEIYNKYLEIYTKRRELINNLHIKK